MAGRSEKYFADPKGHRFNETLQIKPCSCNVCVSPSSVTPEMKVITTLRKVATGKLQQSSNDDLRLSYHAASSMHPILLDVQNTINQCNKRNIRVYHCFTILYIKSNSSSRVALSDEILREFLEFLLKDKTSNQL